MATIPLTTDTVDWRDGLRLLLRELSPFGDDGYRALLHALRHSTGDFVRGLTVDPPPDLPGAPGMRAGPCGCCIISWVCRYRLTQQRHREPTVGEVSLAFWCFVQRYRGKRDSEALAALLSFWDNERAVEDGTLFREVAEEVEREMGRRTT